MKHTISVTLVVLAIFFLAQIVGLFVINNYIDHQKLQETGKLTFSNLPLNFERPELEEQTSFIYIIAAVFIGTLLALALIKFKLDFLWKIWFLVAIFVTLTVSFGAFFPEMVAIVIALVLSLWKVFKPNFYIQNFTEFFIYGGLAAIFVPVLNVFSIILLLLFISAYDVYAVWKSKHMVKLAKFQTDSKLFAGVMIPYKMPKLSLSSNASKHVKTEKVKTAILGGGDIGFPLLFAGVLFKEMLFTNTVAMTFAKAMFVPVFTTITLGWLLYKADKDKFYPAMPFITAGCLISYVVMHFLAFI